MMTAVLRLFAALAVMASAASAALAQHPALAEQPGDHVIGSADAPLTIVEYASFACPHCAHFQEDVWPTVKADFVDTGRVRWIFRPILTNPVQLAAASTILAECAADDRFFDAADLLFQRQTDIFDTARAGGNVLGVYNEIAGEVGLTPEAFSACLQDPAMSQTLNDRAEQASEYEVPGTPSFVIGDDILIATTRAAGSAFYYGDTPLELNGERVPGQMDGDTFSRIVLHFLNESDSED